MNEEIEELKTRVQMLEETLSHFSPVIVHLRLTDGKVYPVTLFARVTERPTQLNIVPFRE